MPGTANLAHPFRHLRMANEGNVIAGTTDGRYGCALSETTLAVLEILVAQAICFRSNFFELCR